jgi:2-keto-4-pentenoate hydratase
MMSGGPEVVHNWSSATVLMLPSIRCSQSIEGVVAVSDNAASRGGVLSPSDAAGTAMDISSSGAASNGILSGETSESTLDTIVVVLELSKRSTE